MSFTRTESDWSVHKRITKIGTSMSATSVDNILLASSTKEESQQAASDLAKAFETSDMGDVEFLLGCRITRWRDRRSLKVDQESYINSMLREFGMENSSGRDTPFPAKTYLTTDMCPKTDEEQALAETRPYRRVVGKCMYLVTCTRPDIAWAVCKLVKFMSNHGEQHWTCAKHLLRYLSGTKSIGLILGHRDNPYPLLKGLSDSDWAMAENRKSISGFVLLLNESPISWSSKQQAIVALSSCEAEYIACTHSAKQIMWLRSLLAELGFPQQTPTTLHCDNTGTVACTHDPHGHTRMKHISIRMHFIRECVNQGLIDVIHISNRFNVADLFTKPLARIAHNNWMKLLNLHPGQGGVLEFDAHRVPDE